MVLTRAHVEAELEGIESRLEEGRIARHLEARCHAQFGRRIGKVVVADAAIALGEGAEDVVAEPGIQRQPAAQAPVVLDEAADVVREVVAPRIALIQVRAAARGTVSGEEERPVVVVEVAVGARHVLAFEADVPVSRPVCSEWRLVMNDQRSATLHTRWMSQKSHALPMPPELRCVLMSIVGISAARPPMAYSSGLLMPRVELKMSRFFEMRVFCRSYTRR